MKSRLNKRASYLVGEVTDRGKEQSLMTRAPQRAGGSEAQDNTSQRALHHGLQRLYSLLSCGHR